MSYNDEEAALDELFGTIYNDPFMGDAPSPYRMAENLQIPLHDDPSYNELDYDNRLSYNDSSLSVPVREYASDAPQLSPISNSYQMSSYEMQETQINSVGYNSFEQPVGVINNEYTHPVEDTPLSAIDSQYNYADEMPSTSGHQIHSSHSNSSNRHHAPSSRNNPPQRHVASNQTSRHRPIQPRTSNVAKPKRQPNDPNQSREQPPGQTVVRFAMTENSRLLEMISELKALEGQAQAGIIGNNERIQKLKDDIMQFFQTKSGVQIATPAETRPQPSRSHKPPHSKRPQQYNDDPSSPYQPQMMLAPNNGNSAPSIYSDYQSSQPVPIQPAPVTPQPQYIRVQGVSQHQQIQMTSSSGKAQVVYAVQTSSHHSGHHSRKDHYSHSQLPKAKVVLAPPLEHQSYNAPSSNRPANVHIIRQQPPPALQPVKMQAPMIKPHVEIHRPRAPIKQSSSSISQVAAQKRNSRMLRLREMLNSLKFGVERPETERPFENMSDVLLRLLPYHSVQEPDFKDEELDNFDTNILRTTINQGIQVNELKNKILKVIYDEPQVVNPQEEQNLLLFLDTEYERRKFEEEKDFLNDFNREFFVASSPLIPALRGMDIRRPDSLSNPPKLVNQYEYYSFNEAPSMLSPVMSPYLMSPSTSHRSRSPVKSPINQLHFHSPRLRQKSTTDDSADHMENKLTPKVTVKIERRMPEKKEPKQPPYARPELVETKPQISSLKLKFNPEVAGPNPSVSSYNLEQKPMPSKKMFLNRARNEIPPALRSPPAMMTRPLDQSNGRDSDGSISPELGDEPPPRVPFIPKATDIKSSELKKLAPLPAPQPKKLEIKDMADSIVFKPWLKTEAKKKSASIEKEVKPLKLVSSNPEPSLFGHLKEVQKEPIEKQTPSPNGILRAPIKLKLKLGGNTITVGGGEDEKKKKEEKKRKKEKKKKRREERERKRKREVEPGSEDEEAKKEYTVVSGGGLRLKLKLNAKPDVSAAPSPANPPLHAMATIPTTSRVNGYTTKKKEDDKPSPPKVPKLKIKLGGNPKENKVEMAQAVAPVSKPTVKPITNGPTLFNAQSDATGGLPDVTFSDQSDNEDDAMRTTNEAMISWGMKYKSTSSQMPFSSSQYARQTQPPPSSFQL